MWLLFFACILPFIVLFGSIFLLRKSVFWSAVAAIAVLLIVLTMLWQVSTGAILAAFVKSSLVTLDIVVILIAALFLITLLQEVGSIRVIKNLVLTISPDRRIQALLIGIFFVGFIEGIAGFGTPAMLAAPLLVAIGFPVRAAILVSLVGNTLSAAFGAVGTPFLIGLLQGIAPFIQATGGVSDPTLQQTLVFFITVGFPLALLLPFSLLLLLTHTFGGNWRDGLAVWKHSLVASLCFTLPVYAIALLFGFEFPSLLGSLIGGGFFVLLLRLPFFSIKKSWTFASSTVVKNSIKTKDILTKIEQISLKSVLFAIFPYFTVVFFLIASRLPELPFKEFAVTSLTVHVEKVFEIQVTHTIRPLYSPALYLLFGALAAILIYKPSTATIKKILKINFSKSLKPIFTLLALIFLAQLLLFSNNNSANNPSIPVFAAGMVSTIPIAWPLVAPFIGMFGALITGSVTVSNILFGNFQAQTAVLGNYSVPLILALQVLGATGGNMIALHNIIAVLAATDPKTSEQKMLALLLKPALMYVLWLGILGYVVHVGQRYF